MMKKVLAMLLASAMVVSMTACGGNSNSDTTEPAAEDSSTEAPAEGEEPAGDAELRGKYVSGIRLCLILFDNFEVHTNFLIQFLRFT